MQGNTENLDMTATYTVTYPGDTEPTTITLAQQTAEAVAAAYPQLQRHQPVAIGAPLAAVELAADGTARYGWCGYEVHVTVGTADHLNREESEDQSLQRVVRAHASLPTTAVVLPEARGHIEWQMDNPRPEVAFPAAYVAAAADQSDPRFASAVLVAVAQALDYAAAAAAVVAQRAADAADEIKWARSCPPGTPLNKHLQERRSERDADRRAARAAERKARWAAMTEQPE